MLTTLESDLRYGWIDQILSECSFKKVKVIHKKTTSEKYIVHLDQYPEYREMKVVKELDGPSIQKHYEKLNILLEQLSKMFNKEVVISCFKIAGTASCMKTFRNGR